MAIILESGEMYLEDILILKKKNGVVRAIDVANYMGFSRPSVSRALFNLRATRSFSLSARAIVIFFVAFVSFSIVLFLSC